MKEKLFYCAFYGPETSGLPGQQNLSRFVRTALAESFDVTNLSPKPIKIKRFPGLLTVVTALVRLWYHQSKRRTSDANVTVVDMIHSLTALPKARSADRLIVIGHDSYALRARRDFAHARQIRARLRLGASMMGWSFAEFLLRRVAWRTFFVSSIDLSNAARGHPSGLLAIPVDEKIREIGHRYRKTQSVRNSDLQRIVVSLPVTNSTQNRIDAELVNQVLSILGERAEVTLWGKGAELVARRADPTGRARVVEWVEDYAKFLQSFQLLVYPRMVGSGFHTKLAEALVLGVPCLCVDWVASPLIESGYDGLTTFSGSSDFPFALSTVTSRKATLKGTPMPILPAKASPAAALQPLIEACSEAINTK